MSWLGHGDGWVVTHKSKTLTIWDLDGVRWWDKPRPRRLLHRHSAQTIGRRSDEGFDTHRCACGASRYTDIPGWTERER